jgi:eukaryotic-like serine/threonine-protein kinase
VSVRRKTGPLLPEEVLRYATQIADALNTAHRDGVIHRDLKPGNIMLTKSGAKLLDFGLAKVAETGAEAGVTVLATRTTPLTGEGTILGTVQYMAPEQLEGKEADARTDLFAFGAVLYEMTTGRKAFEGKSYASLVAAILERDPPPLLTFQPLAPPALDHVVRTCLAKEPEARWETAHDVLIQLKWIVEAGSQAGIPRPVISRRNTRELMAWALVAVLSLIALALVVFHYRETPAELQPVRFEVALPHNVSLGEFGFPVMSPNGRYLVYSGAESTGKNHLWLHSLDSLTTQALVAADNAYNPFWSPDSRFVGFFSGGKLKKIDISGGLAETICDIGGTLLREAVGTATASFCSLTMLEASIVSRPRAAIRSAFSSWTNRGERRHICGRIFCLMAATFYTCRVALRPGTAGSMWPPWILKKLGGSFPQSRTSATRRLVS